MSQKSKRNKGKFGRRRILTETSSLAALLEERFLYLRRIDNQEHPEGGPVIHLSADDYQATKIAEAIQKLEVA